MDGRNPLKAPALLLQLGGALLWGAAIAVAPLELILAAPIATAALVFLDVRRARRYGVWPLLPLRYALMSAVVASAILWGLKTDDTQRVSGLSGATVPLSELAQEGPLRGVPHASREILIRLPSSTPTYRETMRAVEAQTDLVCQPGRCGNGMSLINGGYILWISVAPRNPGAPAVVR